MEVKEFKHYYFYEDGSVYNKYGHRLTTVIKKNRYYVYLHINKIKKEVSLPRLLYYLFKEKFDLNNKNLCVSFKDGNTLNIKLNNLYLTERSNLIQGEGHRKHKITDEQVEQIKQIYKQGNISYSALAKKYNVTKSNIYSIIKLRSRNQNKYIL